MVKLGCTLPNLANIELLKTTGSKFHPLIGTNKGLLERKQEDMFGGPSSVFTRKALVEGIFMRKSTNLFMSIYGVGASQLYLYSKYQPMPTGLITRWEYESETQCFTPCQNKSRFFENTGLSFFPRFQLDRKSENNVTTR